MKASVQGVFTVLWCAAFLWEDPKPLYPVYFLKQWVRIQIRKVENQILYFGKNINFDDLLSFDS